jgi:uncharacterized membrane protein (DUF106 family)
MVFLDGLLDPLLKYNPATVIVIMSLLLSVLITFIYKWMTDQTLMKSLKDDIKGMQEQMKKNRDNPKKLMELQKVAMEKNTQYMMKSMKPTLVTFIPLILIFGWLNAHYVYDPIHPGQEFNITAVFINGVSGNATMIAGDGIEVVGSAAQPIADGMASWKLRGVEGSYVVQVDLDGVKYDKDVVISQTNNYAAPVKTFKEEKISSIIIGVQKLRVFGDNFSIFGWHPGWLGTYIITSIIFSMVLRKLLRLY